MKFDQVIFALEGGFKRPDMHAGKVADSTTLFGFKFKEFERLVMNEKLDGMNGTLRHRIETIRHAPTAKERVHLQLDLMWDVGRTLVPYSQTITVTDKDGQKTKRTIRPNHPAEGEPCRSLADPLPNLNPEQQALHNSVKAMVANAYRRDYFIAPGFNRYPEGLGEDVAIFGVNAGPARARWAVIESMRTLGMIGPNDHYPNIDQAMANDRKTFAPGGIGHAYNTKEMNDRIIERLSHATPEQVTALRAAYQGECDYYYVVLSTTHMHQAKNLNGWVNGRDRPELKAAADAAGIVVPTADNAEIVRVKDTRPVETAQLLTQYRDNGVSRAIKLEIPGRGLIEYDIEATGEFKKLNTVMPDGVMMFPADRLQVRWNKATILNPYPLDNTLSWIDDKGERQYLPLNTTFNTEAKNKGTTYFDAPTIARNGEGELQLALGKNNAGLVRPFFHTPDGHLPAGSDIVHIYNHGRSFAVQDVDKHQPTPPPTPFGNALGSGRSK